MTDNAVTRTPFVATRRQLLAGGAAVAAVSLATTRATSAQAAPAVAPVSTSSASISSASTASVARREGGIDRATIDRWARDTWASMVAMTDRHTGLPADNISGPLSSPVSSGYTSPTNIGGYLWSTVIARELGIISTGECRERLTQTLTTMSRLKHHHASGMFYNWYDEANGKVVTVWPENGSTVYPFLSSVDNGWFAASLMVVRNAEPGVADLANALLEKMNFGMFYNKDARPEAAAASCVVASGTFSRCRRKDSWQATTSATVRMSSWAPTSSKAPTPTVACISSRAGGRHVRGANARSLCARSQLGAQVMGY